nr:zinc finger protein 622 [Quercus suber]
MPFPDQALSSSTASTATKTMATRTFLCSACAVDFGTDAQRRNHMREAWHVYNLKRRMVGMSAISQNAYAVVAAELEKAKFTQEAEDHPGNGSRDMKEERYDQMQVDDDDEQEEDDDVVASRSCLFCSARHLSSSQNMHHMSQSHGFQIPNQDDLQTDLDTFLAYLNRVVRVFHCCLFCDTPKSSTEAIQAHMHDRGHCMLDMGDTSDFLEFWTQRTPHPDDVSLKNLTLSDTDVRLPSGAIVASRASDRRHIPSSSKRRDHTDIYDTATPSIEAGDDGVQSSSLRSQEHASHSTSHALSRRDQGGLIGLTHVQCAALVRAQKKAVSRDLRNKNAALWVRERGGNQVKLHHYRAPRASSLSDPVFSSSSKPEGAFRFALMEDDEKDDVDEDGENVQSMAWMVVDA